MQFAFFPARSLKLRATSCSASLPMRASSLNSGATTGRPARIRGPRRPAERNGGSCADLRIGPKKGAAGAARSDSGRGIFDRRPVERNRDSHARAAPEIKLTVHGDAAPPPSCLAASSVIEALKSKWRRAGTPREEEMRLMRRVQHIIISRRSGRRASAANAIMLREAH